LDTQDLSRLKIERGPVAVSSPRRWRRTIVITAAAVLAVAAAALAYGQYASAPTVETATVANVFPSRSVTLLDATGYVVAQRKAAVSSKATGRLEWLGVLEGSRVKKDDVIARIENNDVTAAEQQAAANIAVAQGNLEQGLAELREAEVALKRSLNLVGKGFISRAAHDAAIARHSKAKASLASLKAGVTVARASERSAAVAVEQTVIRAPFDGVVLTKSANVGDIVTPFSSAIEAKGAVVTMADMETLEVEADVSESNLGKIKVDQPCEIQLEAFPERRFAGVVSRMVPTLDRSKGTLLVKVRFVDKDARVLPDMSAKVAFLSRSLGPDEKRPLPAVQATAVTKRDGRTVVFSVEKDRVRETPVQTGASLGELVEVKGPKPGTVLVLNPPDKLADGMAVKLAKK
jgi:HlyD family secretion protein